MRRKKRKFWVEMRRWGTSSLWRWGTMCINGKGALNSKFYLNRTVCRNAARSFAEYCGLDLREKER